MKTVWVVLFSVVSSLLAVGVLLLVSRSPRGKAVQLLTPPAPPPVTIYVSGAVLLPGVYSLPAGSRVQDAIQAAGGLSPEADRDALNQAALLRDGQAVRVPEIGEQLTENPASERPIDLNTATQAMLEGLPGVGPVLARRILEYRQANGGFASVEELLKVEGLGEETFKKIQNLVMVVDAP